MDGEREMVEICSTRGYLLPHCEKYGLIPQSNFAALQVSISSTSKFGQGPISVDISVAHFAKTSWEKKALATSFEETVLRTEKNWLQDKCSATKTA